MLVPLIDKLNNLRRPSDLKLPLLFLGLAVWVVVPILGVFPLLMFIQLDLLRSKKTEKGIFSLNNIILALVVLTIVVYVSSFDVFADTKVYLDIYERLGRRGPFDNYFSQSRFEFVLFLFFYPIYWLSNGSTYWCLVIFALFTNSLITFHISKKLSPRYYPTLLIILFSNFMYYSQVFYMRQFFSIVWVMAAIAALDSSMVWFIACSALAIFSHLTSAMYIAIAFSLKFGSVIVSYIKIKWQKKDKIFFYFAIGILLTIIGYIALIIYRNPQQIYSYVNSVLNYVPQQQLGSSLQKSVDSYDKRDTDLFVFTIYRAIATVTIGMFVLLRNYKQISSKIVALIAVFALSVLQIAFIQVTGFNQRIAYLFLAFFGLFLAIGLDSDNKVKDLSAISLLTILMATANTYNFIGLQVYMEDTTGWSFFDGQPLAMSVYDYIVYFFSSI